VEEIEEEEEYTQDDAEMDLDGEEQDDHDDGADEGQGASLKDDAADDKGWLMN